MPDAADLDKFKALAEDAKAWPFAEARALLKRTGGKTPAKGYVLFETGYGPSGLPHIGTFAEVARTTMVRRAFKTLSDTPTKLIAFSDDMDGLRKIPDNTPNADMVAKHLHKPLTAIPDPFGTHESFGHHNNARLCAFLDAFGFDYEFKSSTKMYKAGVFDEKLLLMLNRYDAVMKAVLPTLGPERQATYSPFLPVCERTGRVLQARVLETRADAGTIIYEDPDTGEKIETPVTGGRCKLQWKPDWAMRWCALDVDYEMSGKDLIDSVKLSGAVCRILGSAPPQSLTYELFLDENGEKISKSRGNGLAIEDWLRYAPRESLSLFMYQKPKTAKRLYFDAIPRAVDEYYQHLRAYRDQGEAEQLENPVWHIHGGDPDNDKTPWLAFSTFSFSLLLNLASVCNTEDKDVIWEYVRRYRPNMPPDKTKGLEELIEHAIAYYRDFVLPEKTYRPADAAEREALSDLADALAALPADAGPKDVQTAVYEIGKREAFPALKDWFRALYEILLGQSQGPRMGSFFALYGLGPSVALIRRAAAGEPLD
ncbi:MAG: lysine--tRNA ligase [Rhodospirillales bacterium]